MPANWLGHALVQSRILSTPNRPAPAPQGWCNPQAHTATAGLTCRALRRPTCVLSSCALVLGSARTLAAPDGWMAAGASFWCGRAIIGGASLAAFAYSNFSTPNVIDQASWFVDSVMFLAGSPPCAPVTTRLAASFGPFSTVCAFGRHRPIIEPRARGCLFGKGARPCRNGHTNGCARQATLTGGRKIKPRSTALGADMARGPADGPGPSRGCETSRLGDWGRLCRTRRCFRALIATLRAVRNCYGARAASAAPGP